MSLARGYTSAFGTLLRVKRFHTCSVVAARQGPASSKTKLQSNEPFEYSEDIMEDQAKPEDDIPEPGHRRLEQQRQMLYYLRLIEHEMPKLSAYRKAFVPPDASTPLVVRSITYGGENHPAVAKRTIVTPVARLPLKSDAALHKFKVLAGPRWSPHPPKDSGIGLDEAGGEHGYFKISCEDFPKAAMNLKWASDTLDRLLAAANDLGSETFADMPVDVRHLDAKTRKAKKGGHILGRQAHPPSLRDFPKEWLPAPRSQAHPESPSSN